MFVAVLKGYLEDKPNYSDIDLAYHLRLKQAQSEGTGYQPDRSISRPQQHSAGIRRDLAAVKGSDYRAALDACIAEQIRATLCLHRDSPDPETNRCRNTIFSETSADHQVRVAVEDEERGDRPHPVLNVATEHDPTVASDIAGQQQVWVLEIPREEGSASDPANGDPARASIGRVNIVCPLGIVELRGASLDDDVGIGLFPEIDARFVNRRAAGGDRRDVLQIEDRQPFGSLAGERAHHRPIAVRKQHMPVDTRLG